MSRPTERARLRRFFRRIGDFFPWTPLGLLLAAGAALALQRWAYGELDLVALVLGYGALGLVVFAGAITLLATLGLATSGRRSMGKRRGSERRGSERRAFEALAFEADRAMPSGFSLPSLRFVPLLRVRIEIESPKTIEARYRAHAGRLHEELIARSRGEHRQLIRRVIVEDIFGLARLAFRTREERPLHILPALHRLQELSMLRSMTGGDTLPHPMGVDIGDRVDLRRYVAGDPARFIHWKAFARTRKLVVRVPERALSPAQRLVGYLVAGAGDEASAALARLTLESGALGPEWAFGADGSAGLSNELDDALEAIVRSKGAAEEGGAGLGRFLKQAERSGPVSLLLFVPAKPGSWLPKVLDVLKRRSGHTRILVGIDGLAPPGAAPLIKRLLWILPRDGGASRANLSELERSFQAARAPFYVVDRATGRTIAGAGKRLAERAPRQVA